MDQVLNQVGSSKENLPAIDMKQAYANLSQKPQLLIKTYLSNFVRLLKQQVDDLETHQRSGADSSGLLG